MYIDVYIGEVKSEDFDFEKRGNWNGYTPKCISESSYARELYWDIVGDVIDKKPGTKQTDWGCFVIKMTKEKLVEYLSNPKYIGGELNAYTKDRIESVNKLISTVKSLEDGKEYLLVALEIPSMGD